MEADLPCLPGKPRQPGADGRSGFREVGVHESHGRLDGVWRDNVIVELVIAENL
jgi:hypothetical protein